MRVSGLVLVASLSAACGGMNDQPAQRTEQLQSSSPVAQTSQSAQRPEAAADVPRESKPGGNTLATAEPKETKGTSGTGAVLPEPRIGAPATANETAVALADFKTRADAYADLHKELAKGSAKQRETSDPAKINEAQAALAAKVQAARSNAHQGDIFTPAVRPVFRRLLAPELKGADGRDTKAVLEDDAPKPGSVPFKVNARYPDAQPLPTVPANVLATLPELPAPLEYRIVGRHLLLLDTASDLIADYILNAVNK